MPFELRIGVLFQCGVQPAVTFPVMVGAGLYDQNAMAGKRVMKPSHGGHSDGDVMMTSIAMKKVIDRMPQCDLSSN